MPPTSSVVESDSLTKVPIRPETLNNTTDKMCLSSPSNSNSTDGCRTNATCESTDQNSTNTTCTNNSNTCDVRHRKHAPISVETESLSGNCVADEDNNNNKNQLDLSEDDKNETYKECEAKKAKAGCSTSNTETSSLEYTPRIRWPDLTAQVFLHAGALYGIYFCFFAKFYTLLWALGTVWVSGIGITAGAHRLWSHKSYTAALPLRLFLIFIFTITGQRDAYTWALDHRIHHKFSETDADPHDARRGFFFAHVGWLFLTPHPKVEEKRKVIDMSDLENDGVVMFQRKSYIPLFALISLGLPVLVPWYYWNEDLWMSFWINFNLRFCTTLNIAFFVNSVAHMWGRKPYDKNISPVESPFVSFIAMGEGWHNYHHVFPWDYKTSEFSYTLNITTAILDLLAKLGWVSGRKSVSPDMVARRAAKCGDGTHYLNDAFAHKDQVWGYGDRDILKEDAVELATMKD